METSNTHNQTSERLTGAEIKRGRIDVGLTRSQLAGLMGYSYNAISSIENDDFKPSEKFIARFKVIIEKVWKGEVWQIVEVKAKAGTLHEGTTILKPDIPCACGCGEYLVPIIWNQRYLPGHSPRKPGVRKKKP